MIPLNPEPVAPPKTEHPILEIVRFSLIALIIVIPIRMFIAQPFIVSGASMEETFQSGEYLIVDQLSYQRDDFSATIQIQTKCAIGQQESCGVDLLVNLHVAPE